MICPICKNGTIPKGFITLTVETEVKKGIEIEGNTINITHLL